VTTESELGVAELASQDPTNSISSATASTAGDAAEMSKAGEDVEVIKPQPAGTPEEVKVEIKLNSLRSMFENPNPAPQVTTPKGPKRRSGGFRNDWATVKPKEEDEKRAEPDPATMNGTNDTTETEPDPTNPDTVRPPAAGTKEQPEYKLESNFLRSRFEMFSQKVETYKPKNKIQSAPKPKPVAEVVNRQDDDSVNDDSDIVPAANLKDTKNLFERGEAFSQTTVSRTTNDVVPASNLRSAKEVFTSSPVEEDAGPIRKAPIDIRKEATEAMLKEKEIITESVVAQQEVKQVVVETADDQPEAEVVEQEEEAAPQETPQVVVDQHEDEQEEEEEQKEEAVVEAADAQKRDDDFDIMGAGEPAGDSDSETEGEYILDHQTTPPTVEEVPEEDSSEDEAAAAEIVEQTPAPVTIVEPEPEQTEEAAVVQEEKQEELAPAEVEVPSVVEDVVRKSDDTSSSSSDDDEAKPVSQEETSAAPSNDDASSNPASTMDDVTAISSDDLEQKLE